VGVEIGGFGGPVKRLFRQSLRNPQPPKYRLREFRRILPRRPGIWLRIPATLAVTPKAASPFTGPPVRRHLPLPPCPPAPPRRERGASTAKPSVDAAAIRMPSPARIGYNADPSEILLPPAAGTMCEQ